MASAIVGRSDSKRGAFSKRESEVRRALYSSGIMIWITEGYIVMPSYTVTYTIPRCLMLSSALIGAES